MRSLPFISVATIVMAGAMTVPTTLAQQAPFAPGAFLGELSWPEAESRLAEASVVVLPFGAGAKEHGPHLPMNADAVVARYLCARAVEEVPIVVAPMIEHGWFPAFRDFPGTEVADPDVFRAYVMEVASSLVRNGARRLAILNTGIARATGLPLSIVAREIRVQTGVPTLVVSWDDLETDEALALQESSVDGHAGEIETSIHLFLQPDLVDLDAAVADTGDPNRPHHPGYAPGLFSRDPADPAFSESGVLGDPTVAAADKGEAYLNILARTFVEALRGFAQTPLVRPDER